MKYSLALIGQHGTIFDESDFDNLKEAKEWAKGRGRYYDQYTDKHYKYKVLVYEYDEDNTLIPIDEYLEE